MPAPKARRPGNPGAVRKPATVQRAPRRKSAAGPKAASFDGPLYPFIGFRFMCRRRHVRH